MRKRLEGVISRRDLEEARKMLGRHSLEESKIIKGRIPTLKDLINSPTPIPHNLRVWLPLDVEDAVLRDEFLVRRLSLPRVDTGLQASLKSILVTDNKVRAIVFFVPYEAVKYICLQRLEYTRRGVAWYYLPEAGRSLFSPDCESFEVGDAHGEVSSAGGVGLLSGEFSFSTLGTDSASRVCFSSAMLNSIKRPNLGIIEKLKEGFAQDE